MQKNFRIPYPTPSTPVLPLKSSRPKPRLPSFLNDSIESESLPLPSSCHITISNTDPVSYINDRGDHLLFDKSQTPNTNSYKSKLHFSLPSKTSKVSMYRSNDDASTKNVKENACEEVSFGNSNDKLFCGGSCETFYITTGGSREEVKEELQQINIRMKRIKAEQEKLKFVEKFSFIFLINYLNLTFFSTVCNLYNS